MESYKEQDTNGMSVVLAGHLFLSHFLAAGAAVIISENLDVASLTSRIILMMGIAGLLGILLTFNIQRAIRLLDWTLLHLINGIPVRKLSQRGHGPLVGLMARVDALAERERPFTELRDLQLKQNSEAAAQEERNRLARDLHDSIKQQLFSIHIGTAAVQARWESDPDGAKTAVADVRSNAKAALAEMNALLHQLAPEPLEKVGLVQALQVQCEALGHRSGTAVKVDIGRLPEDERFPDGTQTALFRIAQELLSNVARHARAENVLFQLSVSEDEALQLAVTDDGQGFDPQTVPSGMGLGNVRQRVEALGGQLEIETVPNAGTSIRVSIPLQDSLDMKETRMNKPDHLFNKVAAIGLLGGIALNLLLRYPLMVAMPDVIMPPKPTDSLFLAGLLGLTAVPLTIAVGYLAARTAEIGTRKGNWLVGAVAGSIAAFVLFLGHGSVAVNLIGSLPVFEYGSILALPEPIANEHPVLGTLLGSMTIIELDTLPDRYKLFFITVVESVSRIVWWSRGSTILLTMTGFFLGAVGGSFLKRPFTKSEHNWRHLLAGGTELAFIATGAGLFRLVVIKIFGSEGASEIAPFAAVESIWTMHFWGTLVLPILSAFFAYFAGLLLLNWLFRLAQKVDERPHFRLISVAYVAAYAAIMLTFFLLDDIISPYRTTIEIAKVSISLINLGGALLFLKTAVLLEQQFPKAEKRPAWAELMTIGLFIGFVMTLILVLVEQDGWALFVLAATSAVYFLTPRYNISRHTTALGNPIARVLEVSFATVLLFSLTTSFSFLAPVDSLSNAEFFAQLITRSGQFEYSASLLGLPFLMMGIGSLIILLYLVVLKISQSWKR